MSQRSMAAAIRPRAARAAARSWQDPGASAGQREQRDTGTSYASPGQDQWRKPGRHPSGPTSMRNRGPGVCHFIRPGQLWSYLTGPRCASSDL
jgi:hypothetical protein